MNIPNSLTLARVSLAPLLALAMLPEIEGLAAAAIFAAGMASDVVDGYLARSRGLVTRFGELMDPIADKLFVGTALVCLAATHQLALWVVVVVFARDLFVTGLRLVARERGMSVAANGLGKVKTVVQAVTVLILLVLGGDAAVAQLLVYLMVAVTTISGAVYGASYLRDRRQPAAPAPARVGQSEAAAA